MSTAPIPPPPLGSLPESACKEQLSIAYLHAVTAAARCSWEVLRVDYEGVDATVRQTADHLIYSGAQVDVQLKCTSQAGYLRSGHVAFPLERAHYDKLRDPKTFNPRILAVMLVPADLGEWLEQGEEHMLMRRCVYWTWLQGQPERTSGKVTVKLPRSQVLDVGQLLSMLQRIGNGATP